MLEAIRKRTASIVVKLLAFILIMGFVAWGVGDVVTGNVTRTTIASVGGVDIRPQDVSAEYRRELNRLRALLGGQFDSQQARAMGLPNRVVNTVVQRTLYILGADDLGVAVSDGLVNSEIRKNSAFKNAMGQFDRLQFQQVISNSGLSESRYAALVRQDLIRGQYLSAIDTDFAAPDALVYAIYRHRKEQRVAEVLRIATTTTDDPGEPDADALAKYHKENADRFTAPETRALSVITLDVGELAKEVAVDDLAIRDAYEDRADEFTQPERRRLQQMVLKDEEAAKRAHARLSEGVTFAVVAKEDAGADEKTIDIGTVSRNDVAVPELTEPVFALAAGAFSAPVQSPLGWHILRVTNIEPGRAKTFEEVRESLLADLAREKAVDSMFALANRLEDTLGGGATLEEAAAELSLRLTRYAAIDAAGRDADERPVEGLPGGTFLQTVFATEEGIDSPLTDTGSDGYFILRVNGVTPASLKPLDRVRDEAIGAWKKEQRRLAAKKTAEEVTRKLTDGEDIFAIATSMKLDVTTTAPFERVATGKVDLPATLITKLFGINPRQAAMAQGTDGYLIARLKEVRVGNPAGDSDGVKILRQQISQAVGGDLLAQLGNALQQRYPISINRQAVDQLN